MLWPLTAVKFGGPVCPRPGRVGVRVEDKGTLHLTLSTVGQWETCPSVLLLGHLNLQQCCDHGGGCGMVQVTCLVASWDLAAGWHFELVTAQISVGTEKPSNAQRVGPSSSMPCAPQCCVSWEVLGVSGDVQGWAGRQHRLSTAQASARGFGATGGVISTV